MKVEYKPLQNSVLDVCRDLSGSSKEETFSAKQVADKSKEELPQILRSLAWLQETGWIDRITAELNEEILPDEPLCLHKDWLTPGRLYEVLGIEGNYYRLLSDENHHYCPNEPFLYSFTGFIIKDKIEPPFWVTEVGDEGERYSGPPEWHKIGFWEDYHDGVKYATEQFWEDVRKYYPWTWKERKAHS